MGEIRPLGTFDWVDGGEVVIELPRNVSMSKITISVVNAVPVGVGATYDGGAGARYRLDYKGSQVFNRTLGEIQELMESLSAQAPAQDLVEIAPKGGLLGSESNYLRIQCAALADCTTGATGLAAQFQIKFETGSVVVGKPIDFRHQEPWVATTGTRQYRIPTRKRKMLLTKILMTLTDTVLVDSDDALLRIIDLTNGKVHKELTFLELENLIVQKYKYAHNTGYYLCDLDLIIGSGESWVIETTINTAGAALVQDILVETIPA